MLTGRGFRQRVLERLKEIEADTKAVASTPSPLPNLEVVERLATHVAFLALLLRKVLEDRWGNE